MGDMRKSVQIGSESDGGLPYKCRQVAWIQIGVVRNDRSAGIPFLILLSGIFMKVHGESSLFVLLLFAHTSSYRYGLVIDDVKDQCFLFLLSVENYYNMI